LTADRAAIKISKEQEQEEERVAELGLMSKAVNRRERAFQNDEDHTTVKILSLPS